MNTDDLPREPDPADLLASARLDGEPAEPGVVADPSEVAARQEELAWVRDRLAEPVELPAPSVIDDQIARAIAALDAAEADAAEPTPGPAGADAVVPLAPPRRRRSAGRRWLAAAAAVVVVAALAGAIVASNRPHSSSFDTVAAPVDQGVSTTTVAGAASTRAASGGAASTTTAAGMAPDATAVPDLGAVASEEALGTEVLAETTSMASADPTTTTAPTVEQATTTSPATVDPFRTAPVPAPSCDPAVRASVPGLGILVFSATASYQGESVQVLVYGTATPSVHQLIAARSSDCSILVNRPL